MNNIKFYNSSSICLLLSGLLCHGYARAAISAGDSSQHSNYLQLATAYEYSDNLLKLSDNPLSGSTTSGDLSLGYQNNRPTSQLNINYKAYYARHSEKALKVDNYWSGNSSYTRNLFSKNLTLELTHLRHRYLFDQNEVALPENLTERDIFSISPVWRIPYSGRAGFELGFKQIAVNYPEISAKNSQQQIGNISWFHALSPQTKIAFITNYTQAEIGHDDFSYDRWAASMQLSGKHKRGTYLVNAGQSQLQYLGTKHSGLHYEASFDYVSGRNLLTLDLTKQLTDSSLGLGLGQSETPGANGTRVKLLWRERIALIYQYTFDNRALGSTVSLYYDTETPLNVIDPATNRLSLKYYGMTSQLNWSVTSKFSTRFLIDYRDSNLYGGGIKELWRLEISSQYRLGNKFHLQFSVNRFNEKNSQRNYEFDEWRYRTKLIIRF